MSFLSFVWAEMFGNSSCQSRGGTAAAFHRGTVMDSSTKAATELEGHTRFPAVASKTWLGEWTQQPCLESSWHDTSSRRERNGAGSEPGGRPGTVVCIGQQWEAICLLNACPAILPGSQSEVHPVPPSFPWKHGCKGKGDNSSQIHSSFPHPL